TIEVVRHLLHPPLAGVDGSLLTGSAFNHVNAATDSRIEASCNTTSFHGTLGIENRSSDQSLLHGTAYTVGVAGADVPRGRSDDLVVGDEAILDVHPVAQCTARGLPQTGAGTIGDGRRGEELSTAALEGCDELVDPLDGPVG